jgi:hypothetical protein
MKARELEIIFQSSCRQQVWHIAATRYFCKAEKNTDKLAGTRHSQQGTESSMRRENEEQPWQTKRRRRKCASTTNMHYHNLFL